MIPFVRDIEFEYGRPDQVSPLIRRVVANNPGPFTFKGTGTYIIGRGEVAVIDPGPAMDDHLEALLAATHPTGGARLLTPEDLVTVGWLPPAWEASGTRLLNRGGDGAEVEVYGASGDRQAVHTVREGKVWKVELPLR